MAECRFDKYDEYVEKILNDSNFFPSFIKYLLDCGTTFKNSTEKEEYKSKEFSDSVIVGSIPPEDFGKFGKALRAMHESYVYNANEEYIPIFSEWIDKFLEEYVRSFKESSQKSLLETYKDVFESILTPSVEAVMNSLRELYSSCYNGITSPDGILTDMGLLSFEQISSDGDDKKNLHYNHEGSVNDGLSKNRKEYARIYDAILYAIGVTNGSSSYLDFSDKEEQENAIKKARDIGRSFLGTHINNSNLPSYLDISKAKVINYPIFHLGILNGEVALNFNEVIKHSLRKEAQIEHYHLNASKTRIVDFKDFEKYLYSYLFDAYTQYLIDSGVSLETRDAEARSELFSIISSTKNVIAITDKQKEFRTIKVCINKLEEKQGKEILKNIKDYFSWEVGNSSNLSFVYKSVKNDTLTFDYVENPKAYKDTAVLAASVIDSIIESGNIPRWNNAILGKTLSNDVYNYNFAAPGRNAISIYGASGSGKGLMTSAILANALIDNVDIMYIDGKPENGAALAKIAWDEGKEAPVFNGLQGASPIYPNHLLEEFSHGIRDPQLAYSIADIIPDISMSDVEIAPGERVEWPFEKGSSDWKTLIEVTRTLQAFEFVNDFIYARANNEIDKSNFACIVIDEIQDAAKTEKEIRKKMVDYVNKVGDVKISKSEGKISDYKNWSKDRGFRFCKKWISWANSVGKSHWTNVVTKALRASNTTLITIFQDNGWLTKDEKGIGVSGDTQSRIGMMMLELATKVTRIVGKNALISANAWGDAVSKDYAWGNTIDEQALWVISNGENGLSDNDRLMKPFRVYTTDLGKDVIVDVDDYHSGADNCQKKKGEPGNIPTGLNSYLHYLFNSLRYDLIANGRTCLTPEDALQKSFNVFDSFVKGMGVGENLFDYFYNIPKLRKLLEISDEPEEVRQIGDIAGFSLDAEELEQIQKIDSQVKEALANAETEVGTEGEEDLQQKKEQVVADANEQKEQIIIESLRKQFRKEFNKLKPTVGGKISKVHKGLYGKKESLSLFDSGKEDALAEKAVFVSEFDSLLEPLKPFPKLLEECETEVKEFVNGRYAAIENLTYDDVVNRKKGETSELKKESKDDADVSNNSDNKSTLSQITKKSPNQFNGQELTAEIDMGDTAYNPKNIDSATGIMRINNEITSKIISNIKQQFGGFGNIREITVNANGALILNRYAYKPGFSGRFNTELSQVSPYIAKELANGNIGVVCNLGEVIHAIMDYAYSLGIEDQRLLIDSVFLNSMGIGKKGFGELFKHYSNLQEIYLPTDTLTRANPKGENRPSLGSKLANLFNFGKGERGMSNYVPNPSPTRQNENSLTNKVFNSRPVRIMTTAFGWTMGIKAVALAATVFGGWGLLFGALAVTSAVKEIKDERNGGYNTSPRNNQGGRQNNR